MQEYQIFEYKDIFEEGFKNPTGEIPVMYLNDLKIKEAYRDGQKAHLRYIIDAQKSRDRYKIFDQLKDEPDQKK